MSWDGHETWYRVVGEIDPAAERVPLLILHGGPGAAHDYCEPIAGLSRSGRACVLYDQLGCGRSEHLPDAPADFWTVDLFKRELALLAEHLGVQDRYAILGQSWGGMLGMEYALDQPAGLQGLVVADSPASIPLWVEEANRLRKALPQEVQEALALHEEAGTTSDPEYVTAVRVYYDRHLCRVPWPDHVQRSFDQMDADPTVYHTMNGPSEFHCIGSLKQWDITDRLGELSVPTLLISGRHDEATPHIVAQIHARIPGSEWELFESSSHMPHVEEPDAFLDRVERFLEKIDRS
jgi:L-proline amide hydrolase